MHAANLDEWLDTWDVRGGSPRAEAVDLFHAAPGGTPQRDGVLAVRTVGEPGSRRRPRLHPRRRPRVLGRRRAGRADAATSRRTARRQDRRASTDRMLTFAGPAVVVESQEEAVDAILGGRVTRRRCGGGPLRGPAGRPRHAGDALPHFVSQGPRAGQGVRADHRRPVLRRHLGPVDRARLAGGRGGRDDRAGPGRRPHLIDIPSRQTRSRRRRRRNSTSGAHAGSKRPGGTGRRTVSGRCRRRCGPTRRWRPRPTGAPSAISAPSARSSLAHYHRTSWTS